MSNSAGYFFNVSNKLGMLFPFIIINLILSVVSRLSEVNPRLKLIKSIKQRIWGST